MLRQEFLLGEEQFVQPAGLLKREFPEMARGLGGVNGAAALGGGGRAWRGFGGRFLVLGVVG